MNVNLKNGMKLDASIIAVLAITNQFSGTSCGELGDVGQRVPH